MKLFAEYLKEREGVDLIHNEKGFAIYSILNNECYIRDIYVLPEYRKSHVATELANQIQDIAKAKGCKVLTGSVSPQANNSHSSIKVLLAYGMTQHGAIKHSTELFTFHKDIK